MTAERARPGLVVAAGVVVALLVVGRVGWRGESVLGSLADDAYYYAGLADSFVRTGRPSFDGVYATDGYHPLWMAVIVALRACLGRSNALLLAIVATCGALCVLTVDRLARAGDRLGSAWPVPIAAVAGFLVALIGLAGMEVALWFALWAELLRRDAGGPIGEPVEGARRGLLAAALALSRLDSGLFVMLWLLPTVLRTPRRAWIGLGVGLVPLPLWLVAHAWRFGAWVPISGEAKGLGGPGWPSSETWASFVDFDGVGALIVQPGLALGALAAVWVGTRGPRVAVVEATLAFAPLFYAVHLVRSDWPWWFWYAFAALAAGTVGAMVVSRGAPGPLVRVPASVVGGVFAIWAAIYTALHVAVPPREDARIGPALASAMAGAVGGEPGLIGMGDYAGTPAWVLDRPVLQLEGLVADDGVLEALRGRAPLADLLERRGVKFYVGEPSLDPEGCFVFSEPRRAGPRVPRSGLRRCEVPYATLAVGSRTWVVIRRGDRGW